MSAAEAPEHLPPPDITDAMTEDELLDAVDTRGSSPPDPVLELLRPTGILLIGTHYTDTDLHRAMQALPGALRGADHTLKELAVRRAAAILKAAGVEQPMQLIRGVAGNGTDPSRDGTQGEAIRLSEPAPWDDAVSGADLLQQIQDAIGVYVVLPPGGAVAAALWVLHAHAIQASAVSPLLVLVSPEKRCGKTTLLVVLNRLVPKPLLASNITPAVLFRTVEKYGPTLLVDEADSFLGQREELRGLLNSGHNRSGAFVLRAVGDDFEPRAFSTWCPKVVALIGRPPATVEDRSIVLPMRRRRPDEALRRLRLDRLDGLAVLQRQAWRWAQDHLDHLRDADPDVPAGLDDRAADNWRPLLAVADLAGGPWPERAREAARQLSGDANEGDLAPRVQLLADLQTLFHEREVDKLASEELVKALGVMEDRPWMEWKHGRPITVRQVAGLLGAFGIRPKQVWHDGTNVRGYRLTDCADAFARYLPADPLVPLGWLNDATSGPVGDPLGTESLADAALAEHPRPASTLADLADGEGDGGTPWFLFQRDEDPTDAERQAQREGA